MTGHRRTTSGCSCILRTFSIRNGPPNFYANAETAWAEPDNAVRADASASASATERTTPTGAEPIPAAAEWLTIAVVDAATQRPIANAEVWWYHPATGRRIRNLPVAERRRLQGDTAAIAERFGWRTRSDSEGNARIALDERGAAFVLARSGELYGVSPFVREPRPAGGHVLELARDRTLTIRVLDAEGAPARGVPLALRQLSNANRSGGATKHGLVTDERGECVVPHAQEMTALEWGPDKGKPVPTLEVTVRVPKLVVDPVLVDAQPLPDDPVEVRLPPTGRLVVRPTFEGRAIPRLDELMLLPAGVETLARIRSEWTQPVEADGRVRFEHVPLGATFLIGRHQWHVEIDGPTSTETSVERAVDFAEHVYAISGRLQNPGGSPLTEDSVRGECLIEKSDGKMSSIDSTRLKPDTDGRFLWFLWNTPNARASRIHSIDFRWQRTEASPLRTTVAVQGLRRGRNELGDVRLGIEPRVVAGRIVLEGGEPRHTRAVVQRLVVDGSDDGSDWRNVDGLQSVIHRDTWTFEVRGTVEPGRYRVWFDGLDHLPVEPIEFVPGRDDLVVRIVRGHQIQIELLLPTGVTPVMLRTALTAATSVGLAHDGTALEVDGFRDPMQALAITYREGSGTVRWERAPAGTFRLEIRSRATGELLHAIDDVVVPPPDGDDPRLRQIDLRRAVERLHVNLGTGPDGGELGRPVIAFVLPQPSDGPWHGTSTWEDELTIAVRPVAHDVLITDGIHRPSTLRGVRDSAEAALRPWPVAELALSNAPPLPAGSAWLARTNEAEHPDSARSYRTGRRRGSLRGRLNPPRRLVAFVDGRARVAVADATAGLAIGLRHAGKTTWLEQVSPSRVAAGATTAVELSPAEVERLTAELRPDAKRGR